MANILDILEGLLELTLDAKEACPKLLLLVPLLRAAQPHRWMKSPMLEYSLWPTANNLLESAHGCAASLA